MNQIAVFPFGRVPALQAACRILKEQGVKIAENPAFDVTHLLLPVPSFEADGSVRGGGDFGQIRSSLPKDVTVIGGNLTHPLLEQERKIDLLEDAHYVAQNAALTADGAIRLAAAKLPAAFCDCPVLVIGWGRIGKCLAQMLRAMGAQVWVAARKAEDLAMLEALDYRSISVGQIHTMIAHWRVIFNTAPAPVLTKEELSACTKDCIKIDLASKRGLEGEDVIWARGIPGKMLPEASGKLIAECMLRREGLL